MSEVDCTDARSPLHGPLDTRTEGPSHGVQEWIGESRSALRRSFVRLVCVNTGDDASSMKVAADLPTQRSVSTDALVVLEQRDGRIFVRSAGVIYPRVT